MKDRLRDYFPDTALPAIIAPGRAVRIMVLGGTDTGKTTLMESLADLLSTDGPVAMLDLDVGQSTIGPPTTAAWTRLEGGFPGRGKLMANDIAFAGSVTPKGSLLPVLVAAARTLEKACSTCPTVLMDTSGFVEGSEARIYKQFKIDLLGPDLVLALQRGDELEPILQGISPQRRPEIVRIPVPPGVRRRTREERAAWRRSRLLQYFSTAVDREFQMSRIGLRLTRNLPDLSNAGLVNRIVSLRDPCGNDLALGILREIRRRDGVLLLHTPLEEGAGIATVMLGETVSPL